MPWKHRKFLCLRDLENRQYEYFVGWLTDVLLANIVDGKTTISSANDTQFMWCFDFMGA